MRRRRRGKKREKERDGKRQTVEQSLRKREGDREVGLVDLSKVAAVKRSVCE
jgi:hypothetical protein